MKLLICILAGLGAGLGTGFCGLSAAVFITPMLVAFLDVPVYEAVGIALASDVLASAVSTGTYYKHKNIDVSGAKVLFFSVIICAVIGSVLAFLITVNSVGNDLLGYWSIAATMLLGVKFLFDKGKQKEDKPVSRTRSGIALLSGVYIGLVCGFQGTGGGMMLLFVLTGVLRMDHRKAVGTSVCIMTFTALIGAISHFAINGFPDLFMLAVCALSTLLFAQLGAIIANRVPLVYLNRAIGILMVGGGAVMLLGNILG